MTVTAPADSNLKTDSQVFAFVNEQVSMSKHQPIDVKPSYNEKWLTNGTNNSIYKRYADAYDDSPTNQSIINGVVGYIFGDGLVNTKDFYGTKDELKLNQERLSKYISDEDVLLICHDYKKFGGFACQIIYSFEKVPLRIEYIAINKLAVSFEQNTNDVDGYYFSWDWNNTFKYTPVLYPKFTGVYKENDLEIMVVRRATSEPFFPVPDYFSGIPWATVEGQLSNSANNHFTNVLEELTVINYNNGKMASAALAKKEADAVREKYSGTNNNAKVIVSFNEGVETAVTVDRISPPELNQQNVFFSEEAEKKLIVAHSVPPILFQGSNGGAGFSSNADEIEVSEKVLYKRQINPARKKICSALQSVFNMIPDFDSNLDLIDFDEKEEEEING